jgi:hypothetical protein
LTKPPKYIINGKAFNSQDAMRKHFQCVLQSCELGQDLTGELLQDCLCLFERHPEFEQKRGCGIASVKVVLNPVFGDRCFWIYRTDGTETDISYRACVTSKKPGQRQAFMAACRIAIADQVLAFKRFQFNRHPLVKCNISGRLVSESDSHVDHFIPFINLVEHFVSTRRIDIDAVRFKPKVDGSFVTEFACESLKKQWQEYHRLNATLRIAHKSENMAKGVRIPE